MMMMVTWIQQTCVFTNFNMTARKILKSQIGGAELPSLLYAYALEIELVNLLTFLRKKWVCECNGFLPLPVMH